VSGNGRSGPIPGPELCSARLPITIVPQLTSNVLSGPKVFENMVVDLISK
jgi:hypothetical protein